MAGKLRVDEKGMRQKFAHRGLLGILYELIANALDENITYCQVSVKPAGGRSYRIRVEDDNPEGSGNLQESYTLFAPSYKAKLAEKRGRFNLGEKLAIVLCSEARIESTTGTVIFSENRTTRSARRRPRGTLFEGTLLSSAVEVQQALSALRRIIVPSNVHLSVNGERIDPREPIACFECVLPTISEDDQGRLIRTQRKTCVSLYTPAEGESAWIYELGIPIVRPGSEQDEEPFHINVHQKVPLNLDRDNLTPAYLKLLRRMVLDHAAQLIPAQKINCGGVIGGLAGAKAEAVGVVLDKLVGTQRFVQDPSDLEAENRLKGQGYVQMPGGMFSRDIWATVRETGAAQPAGAISPSARPYSDHPDAPTVKLWPSEKISHGMRRYRGFVELVAGLSIDVRIAEWRWVDSGNRFYMCCGPAQAGAISYHVNVARMGVAWFDRFPMRHAEMVDLTIHELGHFDGAEHLTDRYYDNLTRIGAKLAIAVLENREAFERFQASGPVPPETAGR